MKNPWPSMDQLTRTRKEIENIDEYPEFFYWTIGVFHPRQNAAIDDSLEAEVWNINTFDQARHMFFIKNFAVNPEEAQKGPNCLEFPWRRGRHFFCLETTRISMRDEKSGASRNHRLCWWQPKKFRQSHSPVEGTVVGKPIYLFTTGLGYIPCGC